MYKDFSAKTVWFIAEIVLCEIHTSSFEWKRVTRNKALLFFLKHQNIITVLLLTGLLSKNFWGAELCPVSDRDSFVGVLRSRQYSVQYSVFKRWESYILCVPSDFFPEDVLLENASWFSMGRGDDLAVLGRYPSYSERSHSPRCNFLLLLYGTIINYVCVWLGVLFDFKMPRTANSNK